MEPISGPAQPLQCTQIPELITEVEYRAQSPSQLHLCYFCGFFIWQSHKHHSSPSLLTLLSWCIQPQPTVKPRSTTGLRMVQSHCRAGAITGASCAKPVPCQEVFGSLEPTQIFPAMQTDQDTSLGVGASCLGVGFCGVAPSTLSL